MNKKRGLILIGFFIGILVFLYLLEDLAYTNSEVVCGRIIRQSRQSRGGYSVFYTFKTDNKTVEGGIETSFLKEITLDSLKKIDCIQIEYSNYSTFFNRVVDKRILK